MQLRTSRRVDETASIRVVGHPLAAIGMGEHARSVWRALKEVTDDAVLVDVYGGNAASDPVLAREFQSSVVRDLGSFNIFCLNGDEVRDSLGVLKNRGYRRDAINVIYPAWELERYPAEWAAHLNRFDEVWAPSKFIQESISGTVDVPVAYMPLACEVNGRALCSRRRYRIRESAYAFLFMFDFLSYVERKNPFAVIEAFNRLIEKHPFADVTLVIKTNNADRRPDMKARFDEAIGGFRDRVVVINETLSDADTKALVWLCDCFVSLHRSEGFGRGLAEAMVLGRPVVATGYSGNLDFCTPDCACLVPYDLIPVRAGEYPHWEEQHWANPDIDAAAAIMADLATNPRLGQEVGRKGQIAILKSFSYLAAGVRYMERIKSLNSREAA